MIDYDELDERIRRIVREEMSKPPSGELESLENADTNTRYVDAYGDTWEFNGYREQWRDTSNNRYYDGDNTDHFGPFTKYAG